jgi:alpha-D-ribose 1-methylphosphonate 5-triphosphate diphosphatase PhnM
MNEEECLQSAARLRDCGVAINVATVQGFSGMPAILDRTHSLLSAGLVDLISTDYGGGHWDPILVLVEYAVQQGLLSLPKAVAMATAVPAACFPRMGADRGLLKPGRRADFVITAPGKLADVRYVYGAGKQIWPKPA